MRVLIIDDDQTINQMLCLMFRRAGHEAVSTEDSHLAAELAVAGSYDLVITDLEMPGKTGPMIIAELWTRGYRNPIILMSGNCHALEEQGSHLWETKKIKRLVKKPFRGIDDFIGS